MGALFGETIDTRSPVFARLTDDAAILQQWVELFLQTQRGLLWTAPDCGRSLRQYLLAGITEAQFQAIPADIKAGLEEDERIARATVEVLSSGTRRLRLGISIAPKGAPGTTFVFVVSLVAGSAEAAGVLVSAELRGS